MESSEAMRKILILAALLVSAVALCSAGLLGQEEAPPNPARQNGAAPRQMRGPAPPVPGPPHDPHDLTGVWNPRRGYGGATFNGPGPEMTDWGRQQLKLAKASNNGDYTLTETNDPILTQCLMPGTPRIYLQPVPMQVIHTPKGVLFIFEYDHIIRQAFTDGRKHPDDITPTYMGHSLGSWDGDVFVVDTVGFNEKTWVDRVGHAHSDQLHVVERFHRLDQNNLDVDITMEDPKALAKPWNVHFGFSLEPTWDILEQACPDNYTFVGFEK
jgi:hypothetical protein